MNKLYIKICVYLLLKLNDRRIFFGIFDINIVYKRFKVFWFFFDILLLCGCLDKWNVCECGENVVDGRLMNILMKNVV